MNKIIYIFLWIFFNSSNGIEEVESKTSYETANFVERTIDDLFQSCNLIKIFKNPSTHFHQINSIIPAVHLHFGIDHNYSRVLEFFIETPHHNLVTQHNEPCWIFLFSLKGFGSNDTQNLFPIFKIKYFEVHATFSYLLVSEFEETQTAQNFITSQDLHLFQHRLIVESKDDDSSKAIFLKRFCYFCQNGNPGFLSFSKALQNSLPPPIHSISEIFPDVTKNFYGKTMRVTGPVAPPLVLITPSKTDPGRNEIQGQHANILKSFAKHFNFTYTLYTSPGGKTGIKLPNGTWNGIMGEVLYGRADIGLSVATSHERYKIVDVTVSVFYAFLVLVSTKPKPVFEWEAIFYPFKSSCWMAFIVSTIFTFFASKWLHNNSIKYEIPASMRGRPKIDIASRLKKEFMTSYKSFYITVGQLLEQGTPFDFDAVPSRMYTIFWMFFAMIITTAYRSKLFTFLTFPKVEVPPNTFFELSLSKYKWGMKHLGGIAYVFITKSPLSYIRQVGDKMAVYNDRYGCLDRTFKERFTCIIYKAYIDYVAEVRYWKVRHQLHISDFVTPPVGSSWVLPKHAPWLPAFDKICSSIYEMNLADKYLYDYQVKVAKVLREKAQASNSTDDIFDINNDFKGDDDDGPKPLVMANLYAAFFILLFGVSLAALICLLEIIRKNNFERKIQRKRQRLRVHLRRNIKQKKRRLPPGVTRLSFQQVVRVIGPNSNDIIELSNEYPLR